MRTHGSARRSRAIWSRRRVSSFSRASSVLRSATHSSLDTTGWFSVLYLGGAGSAGYVRFHRFGSFLRLSIRFTIPSVTAVARTLSAGHRNGGSDKCDGIPMDSLITAAARALAAGDLLGVLKRVAPARRRACARASRHRDGATRRFRARKGSSAKCGTRLRSERGRGARAMRRRRGRDRARVARPGLAAEGARRGAGDARKTRRLGQRRACAASRGPAPSADRASRRGRACARRARSGPVPARVEGRPRTGRCGDRDAARSGQGGARCARSGRARRAPGRHPGTDGGGRKRIPSPEHAGGAPDCARRGATPSSRGG